MAEATAKAIICTNDAWTLYHFRGSLMRALTARGFEVVAAGPRDRYSKQIEEMGVRFAHIPMSQVGLNPLEELRTLMHLYRLYRREKPALVHHYSHKAILYGTLAARMAGIPSIVNTVNGLGTTLGEAKGMLRLMQPWILRLMKVALRKPVRLTFQNPELLEFYIERGLVRPEQSTVILGSGVDTGKFAPAADAYRPAGSAPVRFLMFSRMMWSKGVEEYCRAAERIAHAHKDGIKPEFVLIGGATSDNATGVEPAWLANPGTIPGEWLEAEAAKGHVSWKPHLPDMLPFIHAADVVVLPSYYPEGLPRSLLEAMACGKAIITTDTPGCRDAVDPGINGILVKPKDVDDLARAMMRMIDHPELVREMGDASRRIVLSRFSDDHVIDQTFGAYAAAGVAV
jgi:glycosyltransferase involved in cell wall biosynthesis